VADLELLTIKIQQMTIERTNDNTPTTPAITYSECYAQVFLGDCLELYKNIEQKSIDLILTDLPYGTTQNKWDSIIPFDKLWEMVNYLLKPNGAFITTASQPFTSALVMSNTKMFKYDICWHKRTPSGVLNANKMPIRTHETILVFYNSLPTYNPIKTTGNKICGIKKHKVNSSNYRNTDRYTDYNDDGSRFPTSVLDLTGIVNNSNEKVKHPTQKPIKLMDNLIRTYSNEGMTIFDPCMGSGTTGVACKNLNRNFIGIEKDEQYFKIAEQRINAHTLFS
jgi:DNA modification methylase